jgi:PAS domain-containing protein
MGVLSRISKINPWHFLWIAIVLSEVFTLISTAVLSLVWWGAVSRDLLIIGSIDALVVSLPVAGIVIYFLNKTYRLAAEVQAHKAVATSLKSRGAYFQTILNVFPDPLMVINADYTIDFTNAAAQNFAGRDSIVGSLTCYEASHQASAPCDGASHPCPMEMVRTRKEMVHVQHEHFDGQGAGGGWIFTPPRFST